MWQAVGMSQAGLINRRVAGQMGVHHSVIDCLMHRLQTTGMVDEQPLPGRPCKTKPRGQARRNCFATSARIRDELNFGGHVSENGNV